MLRCLPALAALLVAAACAVPTADSAPEAFCADAHAWSQRAASWPTDALFLGDAPLDQAAAIELLELPDPTPVQRLSAALVVAELNLSAGGEDTALTPVYAAHAWFANRAAGDAGSDEEALVLAEALEDASVCP
ncbi:MAG: hypothetical protein H6734_07040 [Alphaproteobacteria bacterium]|nr:hypothetical protein [Alphaproteobacteria bacterium]